MSVKFFHTTVASQSFRYNRMAGWGTRQSDAAAGGGSKLARGWDLITVPQVWLDTELVSLTGVQVTETLFGELCHVEGYDWVQVDFAGWQRLDSGNCDL